jgi:signal transduction histidine kinase
VTALAKVAVLGALATVAVSVARGMSFADTLLLVLITGGAAVLAGLLGTAVLKLFERRSLATQVAIAAMIPVSAVAVAAVTAAGNMFISAHDLSVLVVVLCVAATIGAASALWLGRRVGSSSRALGAIARRIGEGETVDATPVATEELRELARELEATSQRLAEARSRERALEGSRRELVAWVSHDLRTPLAGIRAMVEALEDGVVADPEDVARYHRVIRRETDRLAGLVDDLFELSRINAGTLQLQLERVALGDLVSDALAAAAETARAKGVRLEGRLRDEACEVELAPPQMARAMRNLLSNAIRHTPGDGTVSVEARLQEGHALVAVTDACGGISASDQERVFDVAWRGEAARTPGDDGGAGLGLAIARGIVEAHAGSIDVGNEGAGCRFEIRLPLPSPRRANPAALQRYPTGQ